MPYSSEVASLQEALNKQGANPPLVVDGIMGAKTQAALDDYNARVEAGTVKSVTSNNSSSSSSINTTPSTSYYDTNQRSSGVEQTSLTEVNALTDTLKGSGIVSSSFIKKLAADSSIIAFYVNALAYGDYTIGDVLNDIKRRELVENGNTAAASLKIIDSEQDRDSYYNTTEGKKALNTTASLIPTSTFQGLLNDDILQYGSSIPEDLFTELVPVLNKDSDEYKDAVSDLMATYSDLAETQLQAKSEQEKAVADYNYNQFKEQVEKKYGITLSDNATTAWNQIESLMDTYSNRNIAGSGLEAENIDEQLKTTRLNNSRSRDAKATESEAEMASYYAKSATAEQIQALIDEDVAKGLSKDQWRATKWGLVPSDDVLSKYSISYLRSQYPDLTTAELKAKRNAVLDENGNYRSQVYKDYYSGLLTNYETQKFTAEAQVLKNELNKENKAYSDYSTKDYTSGTTKISQPATQEKTTSNKAASDAASNISKSLNSTNNASNTGKTTTPTPAPQNTTPKTTTTTTPKSSSSYTGSSIVDYIKSTGGDSSYSSRAKLAASSGINNYTGTAEQNTQLLKILRGS